MFSRSIPLWLQALAVALAILAAGVFSDFLASAAFGQDCVGKDCVGPQCRNPSTSGWRAPARIQTGPMIPASSGRTLHRRALEPAVVQVIRRSGNSLFEGTGTIIGVLMSTPRVAAVLATLHGARPGGNMTVVYAGKAYPAQLVDQDEALDLALLTFAPPAECHFFQIASDNPPVGTPMAWEGFAQFGKGPTRREGPVYFYEDDPEAIWVTGDVLPGMSGGPIFSRLHGLVSIITRAIDVNNRTPAIATHTSGPTLQRIRDFLGRGRYAWALDGCVQAAKSPPKRLPLVPVETGQGGSNGPSGPGQGGSNGPSGPGITPNAVELSGILAELAALRETIEALELKQGPPGEKGDRGEAGNPGAAATIDMAALVAEIIQQLPPIYVRSIDDVTGSEKVEEIFLGEGFTIRNSIPE